MHLIVISNESGILEEYIQVTKLFEEGLMYFHLRKPNFPKHLLEEYINNIPKEYHDRIIIHSHYDLCLKYNLKGIHLTKKHKKRPFQTWLKILYLKLRRREKLTISATIRSLREINPTIKKYSYTFISPVFRPSKRKKSKPFNEIELQEKLYRTNYKIIALGGVSKDHLTVAKNIGFHGVAILSYIWKDKDPIGAFKNIKLALLHQEAGYAA